MPVRNPQSGLVERRLGTAQVGSFTAYASAPLTALMGGVLAAYLIAGNAGLPLLLLVLVVVLAVFAAGYAAMSRHVSNAAAGYAHISQGLGASWGVSGAFLALLAWNALQVALYGLFGALAADLAADRLGLSLPWWTWSVLALVVVALLGVMRIDLNGRAIGVLLLLEITLVVGYVVMSLRAGGPFHVDGLRPGTALAPGIGGALALGLLCFMGFTSAATYADRVRDPRRTVARATYLALAVTGVLAVTAAWAMNVGPTPVLRADPARGSGLLLETYGAVIALPVVAHVLLLISIAAVILQFHHGIARYLFTLGRQRVLPSALGRTGVGLGAPVGGSVAQTLLALATVAIFAADGADPYREMFAVLAYLGATALLLLLVMTSLAVIAFFRGRGSEASAWQSTVAPTIAAVCLSALTGVVAVSPADVWVGDPALAWILPVSVLLVGLGGLAWGMLLRRREEIYQGIGRDGTPADGAGSRVPGLTAVR